jgi:hypothetical protein
VGAREDIVGLALSHVGKREEPTDSNLIEFAAEYGIAGQAWCGAFVSSVYKEAGFPIFGPRQQEGFTFCPRALNYARESGEAIEVGEGTPQPGTSSCSTGAVSGGGRRAPRGWSGWAGGGSATTSASCARSTAAP